MLADVEQGREAEKDKHGWWLCLMFNGKILNYGSPLHSEGRDDSRENQDHTAAEMGLIVLSLSMSHAVRVK